MGVDSLERVQLEATIKEVVAEIKEEVAEIKVVVTMMVMRGGRPVTIGSC